MDEGFDLPVTYNGKEMIFAARLLAYSYSYKLQVEINGQSVLFEPDEERNWRAMVDVDENKEMKKTDIALLKAIAASIEEITK